MITTPAGIQKLMGETREELIARVCAQNVQIRRERAEAKRELEEEKDKVWSARSEARQAREALEPLRLRMITAERRLDKLETVIETLRATREIDDKMVDILMGVIRDV